MDQDERGIVSGSGSKDAGTAKKQRPQRKLPTKTIGYWDNDCFWPTSLRELGLEICLGHPPGEPCSGTHPAHKSFLVFDANGYHSVDIRFCVCSATPPWKQLLDVGWYPASSQDPRTAFTFAFLDTFHRITLQGKISLHDYYLSVTHKTDNAGLNKPMSRYHEATLATRQWSHLMLLKRAARGHDPLGISETPNGALAVLCPACPQPGWNIPDDWDQCSPEQRWIYTLFLALDACFRLKNKDRKINDPELGSGWGYCVAEAPYQEHLKSYVEVEETTAPCDSTFNAIKHMNSTNSKPGVMSKGEKYVSMDYILWSTLLLVGCMLPIAISYDIACQWKQNLWKRHATLPTTFATELNFLLHENTGLTHGETIEQEWAHIGGIATMTRDMGPAARHHTLNDHWGSWNFRKTVGLGTAMYKSLLSTLLECSRHQRIYEEYTARFSPALVCQWEAMIHQWELDHKKPNPYDEPEQGEDTINVGQLRKALAEQDAQEASMRIPSLHPTSANAFIRQGFLLRDQQWNIRYQAQQMKANATDTAMSTLQERRTALYRSIQNWYDVQDSYMPAAITRRSPRRAESGEEFEATIRAENLVILMPSDIALPELRNSGCVGDVIDKERQTAARRKMKHSLGGQKEGTRSKTLLGSVSKKLQQAVNVYQTSYTAVKILDPTGDWTKHYHYLSDDDVRGPFRDDQPDEAERRRTPSWIWTVPGTQKRSAETDDRDADEHMRGEWARQRARSRRCAEEVVLLVEEMRRVLTFLRAKAAWWEKRRELRVVEDRVMRGLDAYACRQARILTKLGTVFALQWLPLLKISNLGGDWIPEFDIRNSPLSGVPAAAATDLSSAASSTTDMPRPITAAQTSTSLGSAVDKTSAEHAPFEPYAARGSEDTDNVNDEFDSDPEDEDSHESEAEDEEIPKERGSDGRKLALSTMIKQEPCLDAHWEAIKERICKLAFEMLAIGRIYDDQPTFATALVVCTVANDEDWQFLWDYVDFWPLRIYLRFLLSAYARPAEPVGIALKLRKTFDDYRVHHESATASTASIHSDDGTDSLES
ncbi:hypothetical protein PUNSTDRAFT_138639 [Punctularia strigosozonata HHB-11173 SS5]|uniref:CxC2-like cysteine cluster KDZ transposase-associated domain-containing protein n=1 Tax=Punctularia strigosozonata (strain HHB-11173) TaxID=741275 RepID=R7S3A1_PUNST|nr:uncharacterized protein PUNSTDRAFT_138639 [Punctularia strigosozonata HHB-11173 SS5]EIN04247.1 hypothetical protein PUNSTDRAFT_138639 [Punctularia strigosozonata HHB-11173 SS5]